MPVLLNAVCPASRGGSLSQFTIIQTFRHTCVRRKCYEESFPQLLRPGQVCDEAAKRPSTSLGHLHLVQLQVLFRLHLHLRSAPVSGSQ